MNFPIRKGTKYDLQDCIETYEGIATSTNADGADRAYAAAVVTHLRSLNRLPATQDGIKAAQAFAKAQAFDDAAQVLIDENLADNHDLVRRFRERAKAERNKISVTRYCSLGVRPDGVERYRYVTLDGTEHEEHVHVSFHAPYYHFGRYENLQSPPRYDLALERGERR